MSMLQHPKVKSVDIHPEVPGKYVDTTITAANALLLYSAPYSLLASPGTGLVNLFDGARITLDYGSAAYASTHDATIRYTDSSGQVCATLTASGFFTATSDQVRYLYPVAAAGFTPVKEAALVLYVGTGEMTTGDSPLKIRLFYHVVPTSL